MISYPVTSAIFPVKSGISSLLYVFGIFHMFCIGSPEVKVVNQGPMILRSHRLKRYVLCFDLLDVNMIRGDLQGWMHENELRSPVPEVKSEDLTF